MPEGIEKFKIYILAERLEIFVYKVTEKFPSDERFRSVDQLRRSSSSATDNISEGYHRFSFGDKINKLYIARGEAGETMAGINKAHKNGFVSIKIKDFCDEKYTELIKGINGYIKYLKNKQSQNKSNSKKHNPN